MDRKYQSCAQQLRDLRVEVEELEQLEEERDKFYGLRCSDMQGFKDGADKFAAQIRSQVQELRSRRDELKSSYLELHKQNNPDMRAAEFRKLELLALKEKMACSLEYNNRVLAELRKTASESNVM